MIEALNDQESRQEVTLTLDQVTLHARPAALFVERANTFKCDIRVKTQSGGVEANGKSILGILGLDAGRGSVITIRAEGEDAAEAIASLSDLLAHDLGTAE
jgi:phosphotransferase system HPr (HPr) family protein